MCDNEVIIKVKASKVNIWTKKSNHVQGNLQEQDIFLHVV